ncbi:hemin uptake protein HemP [Nitratireductor indicus]|nr:hemin uptake protein HemP [Nitratireductor indicus]MDS1135465.1 hemin uptake protein HemP [Nitratireductor indicus]
MRQWNAARNGLVPDRTVSSVDLFEGRKEIGIEHHGAYYRLKITRQGKLILNK